jgi:hypothetical protein
MCEFWHRALGVTRTEDSNMGWASRAKQGTGNPAPEVLPTRVIDYQAAAKEFQQGAMLVSVGFSDRTYAMNRKGTLRRLSRDAVTGPPEGGS